MKKVYADKPVLCKVCGKPFNYRNLPVRMMAGRMWCRGRCGNIVPVDIRKCKVTR